ncbi:hypothetical protein VTK73DRAFT_4763 [Phialemonium thermophilum]|uniref:DNA-binding protein REB1 n=1 Tax=Phialemonium thermophilum TaxID=223376 RepID=A0ABR3WRN5_9PEZI
MGSQASALERDAEGGTASRSQSPFPEAEDDAYADLKNEPESPHRALDRPSRISSSAPHQRSHLHGLADGLPLSSTQVEAQPKSPKKKKKKKRKSKDDGSISSPLAEGLGKQHGESQDAPDAPKAPQIGADLALPERDSEESPRRKRRRSEEDSRTGPSDLHAEDTGRNGVLVASRRLRDQLDRASTERQVERLTSPQELTSSPERRRKTKKRKLAERTLELEEDPIAGSDAEDVIPSTAGTPLGRQSVPHSRGTGATSSKKSKRSPWSVLNDPVEEFQRSQVPSESKGEEIVQNSQRRDDLVARPSQSSNAPREGLQINGSPLHDGAEPSLDPVDGGRVDQDIGHLSSADLPHGEEEDRSSNVDAAPGDRENPKRDEPERGDRRSGSAERSDHESVLEAMEVDVEDGEDAQLGQAVDEDGERLLSVEGQLTPPSPSEGEAAPSPGSVRDDRGTDNVDDRPDVEDEGHHSRESSAHHDEFEDHEAELAAPTSNGFKPAQEDDGVDVDGQTSGDARTQSGANAEFMKDSPRRSLRTYLRRASRADATDILQESAAEREDPAVEEAAVGTENVADDSAEVTNGVRMMDRSAEDVTTAEAAENLPDHAATPTPRARANSTSSTPGTKRSRGSGKRKPKPTFFEREEQTAEAFAALPSSEAIVTPHNFKTKRRLPVEVATETPQLSAPSEKRKTPAKSNKGTKTAGEANAASKRDTRRHLILLDDDAEPVWDSSGRYRHGPLTHSEAAQLTKTVEDFRRNHGMEQFDLNVLIHENPKKGRHIHKEFWDEIQRACPQRTRGKLMVWTRHQFHNFVARGQWTEDQDRELEEMVAKYGKKWSKIGQLINRDPADTRDRWRNYLVCKDNLKQRAWSEEEVAKLLGIVSTSLLAIQNLREEDPDDERLAAMTNEQLLDWAVISEKMGFTRSRLQIQEKWKRLRQTTDVDELLASRLPSGSSWRLKQVRRELAAMSERDKVFLIRRILSSRAKTDSKIPWPRIVKQFEGRFQRQTLATAWDQLKQDAPGFETMTTYQCARYIIDQYRGRESADIPSEDDDNSLAVSSDEDADEDADDGGDPMHDARRASRAAEEPKGREKKTAKRPRPAEATRLSGYRPNRASASRPRSHRSDEDAEGQDSYVVPESDHEEDSADRGRDDEANPNETKANEEEGALSEEMEDEHALAGDHEPRAGSVDLSHDADMDADANGDVLGAIKSEDGDDGGVEAHPEREANNGEGPSGREDHDLAPLSQENSAPSSAGPAQSRKRPHAELTSEAEDESHEKRDGKKKRKKRKHKKKKRHASSPESVRKAEAHRGNEPVTHGRLELGGSVISSGMSDMEDIPARLPVT